MSPGRAPAVWFRLATALPALAVTGLVLTGAVPAHSGSHGESASIWSMWSIDPIGIVGPLLFSYLYFNGLRKWPNPSHPVRLWQRISFALGQLTLFAALVSPIDPLSDQLFFMHQIQHLMLRVVAPVLILLGAPLTPVLRGLPDGFLYDYIRPIAGNRRIQRGYARLMNPVLTLGLFVGTLWVWQIQELQNLVVRNVIVHVFMHFTMFASAMLYWWLVIDPAPHRSRIHYGLRVLYVAITIIPNTALGAIIVFSSIVLYSAYGESGHAFNISALDDQLIGGLILWLPMEMMSVIIAGIVFIMWFMNEERAATGRARRGPRGINRSNARPAPSNGVRPQE